MPKLTLYKPLLDAIAILIAAQIGIYIYSASLPFMQSELHTTEFLINCTLTSFILTSGISQLFIGPLSDFHDNKKLILLMMALLCLSTVAISITNNIYVLIFLRGVQGFAAGSLAVLARALLKNNYSAHELVKYIALYAIASTIIPIISPIIGGIVQSSFNWRAIFAFMAIYLALLLGYFYFKLSTPTQTLNSATKKNLISSASSNYCQILKSPIFIALALSNAIIFYIEMVELTFSSYILQVGFRLSPVNYGAVMAVPAFGFIIGSLLILSKQTFFSNHKLIMIGIYTLLLSGALLLLNVLLQWNSMLAYIIAITITNIALAIAISPIVAKAFTLFPTMSGSAIALMGFIQMAGASLLSYITGRFLTMSQINFSGLVIAMGIILFALINSLSEQFTQDINETIPGEKNDILPNL